MTWNFNEELQEEILTALENGEGLNAWCKKAGRPSRHTVLRYMREDEDFATKCARAREAAGDLALEEQSDIVKRTLSGELPSDVARVVLSNMQWRAEKLAPKKYGAQLKLQGDKESPLEMTSRIAVEFIKPQNDTSIT